MRSWMGGLVGVGLLAAGACACVLAGPVVLEGDNVWRYYKGTNTPAAQSGGTATWTTVTFDHSAWLGAAPMPIGYGDSDDATVLSDMQNGYTTVFVRRRFQIGNAAGITHLTLAADYDDGFVAYLNNQEVARRTVAAGAVSHTTVASANHEASRAGVNEYAFNLGQNEKEFITLDPALLVDGTNILSVSGHNVSSGSSDFTLSIELYTNVTLVRGPLLQIQHSGRVTVTWRTDVMADSTVDYGYDATYAGGTVSNAGPVRWHAVELPALAEGSTVHYRVRSAGVVLATNQFRSPPGAHQSFRLAAIGDFGSATLNTKQVADRVAAGNPDLKISVGDNIYQTGQPGSFDGHWFQPYSNVIGRVPVLTVLGNHDIRADTGSFTIVNFALPTNGPAGLEERNFSFDYGPVHFVGIDSNPFDLNETTSMAAIRTWVSNDLAQTTQRWKIVFYHHPPHTSNGSHGDLASFKSQIAPLLEQFGVQFAFQGHNHWYERINPINGVNYITTGGGGFSLHSVSGGRKPYSAELYNSGYSFVEADISPTSLAFRCVDQNGVVRDSYQVDLGHPFLMDGKVDNLAWARASNTLNSIRLYAAIRGHTLYVAGQDAQVGNGVDWFGNDHFIYVNNVLTTQRAANWAKSGEVMDWSAFLGDEAGGAFSGWFDRDQNFLTNRALCRSISAGLNGYPDGALEGTLNLPMQFGAFPTNLALAFGPYGTADGGALLWEYQIPPGTAGTSINPGEFLWISTRDLALDLPVAEAGSNAIAEAGMWVTLDGTGSSAPSGLPLSYAWGQDDGPAGQFSNSALATALFRLTNNVPAATSMVVHLLVHDTRFDSNDVAQLTFTPMQDSDNDGLSDQEETTGLDNVLTWASPQGSTSVWNDADSDDDGVNDGLEALAGTDRLDAGSLFQITSTAQSSASNLLIRWSSVPGRLYTVQYTTNLLSGLVPAQSNIPASEPLNTFTMHVDGVEHVFYVIEVQP